MSQTENETPGAEYPNENDSEDTEANKTSEVSTLCKKYYQVMKSWSYKLLKFKAKRSL